MITANYSANNYQPAFGTFNFSEGAKNILKKKINAKNLSTFETICMRENKHSNREIFVSATLKNGSYSGSRLTANIGDGKTRTQGLLQSVCSFLEESIEKANKFRAQEKSKVKVANKIDELLK